MHNRRWVGDDLWNLLYCTPKDLRIIYPGHSWESLRAKRKLYRKKVKRGEIMPPSRSEAYPGPEDERDRAKQRREALSKPLGQKALSEMISMEQRKKLHDQLDVLLDKANLPPETVDQIRIKKVSAWEMGYKDTEGEAQTHPLFGIQLEADPVKFTPEWPVVTRVESVKLPRREVEPKGDARKAVILSDLQYPYADEKAVEVALQIVRDVKPDKVVLVGDMLDLAAWGKYEQRPEFAAQTQAAVIQAHQLLATLRKLCPAAEIAVLEGNHDARMEKSLLANARQAFGLRRADALDGWPVMSVPYLTAMDDLDVNYVSGYPANRFWLNDNLQIRHGQRVRSGGSTAKLVADDERVSTIFGHVHRIETHYKTTQVRSGGRTNAAYAIGCLCRIDGSVPSVKNGYDLSGRPVENFEDWQQAIAVVDYEEGNAPFNVTPIYINTFNNYQAVYNGKRYEALSDL